MKKRVFFFFLVGRREEERSKKVESPMTAAAPLRMRTTSTMRESRPSTATGRNGKIAGTASAAEAMSG